MELLMTENDDQQMEDKSRCLSNYMTEVQSDISVKMSQAELAKLINEHPQVVQEYENGKAVPNQAVLTKMEKVLGVKLRGKVGK